MSNEVVLSLSETERVALENAVKEAAGSLLRMDSERDLVKQIGKRIKKEFNIKSSYFNKITKMYHKQNKDEIGAQAEMIVSLYETVFKE